MITPAELADIGKVVGAMEMAADSVAMAGLVQASGVMLAGRQAIRMLLTRIQAAEKPAETVTDRPAEAPAG